MIWQQKTITGGKARCWIMYIRRKIMENSATFRFYEELNDFLPREKRKITFEYLFNGGPSIKDAIEANGIPHVEVDLILVNGRSVGFDYTLKGGDCVSVYPIFESLDITSVCLLRESPLREMKFILDTHLGKLAKHLRLTGFDTIYRNDFDDKEIIRISLAEHRVILTRDIGMLKVKSVIYGYFVRSQIPREQILEVIKHFDLYRLIKPFSRCIKCNGKLTEVEKEEIVDQLKPLTKKYFNQFFRCTGCQSIFWEGSHLNRMKELISEIEKRKESKSPDIG